MGGSKKSVKVSVLLDEDLYRIFEEYCRRNGFKKSTLAARLIREHLSAVGFTVQTQFPFKS
jgi:hypothetical protein